jgi:class 3 adenylate cyclase
MRAALARHDEILRHAVEKRDGHVVKTAGDGMHAAFALAHHAVAAAAASARSSPRTGRSPSRCGVRMGLHTGGAELRAGDYFGLAVNVAAAAHGVQIVASAWARRAWRSRWQRRWCHGSETGVVLRAGAGGRRCVDGTARGRDALPPCMLRV